MEKETDMPDENKFAKLREVGYTIPVTCGLCLYGPAAKEGWAECKMHRYEHLRQSSPEGGRGVSVHTSGTCPFALADYTKTRALGAHSEFLPS